VDARHPQITPVLAGVTSVNQPWVQVEDRFTPLMNSTGHVLAIEGIVDRVRCPSVPAWFPQPHPDTARVSTFSDSSSLN